MNIPIQAIAVFNDSKIKGTVIFTEKIQNDLVIININLI